MAIIWLGGKVTNGQAHFDLQPDWFGTGVLVTGLLAGGGLLVQAREDRRLGRQRCRRCGRSGAAVAMAVPLRRRTARVALGIVGGVGSVMLVPVGAMAVVGFTRVALGLDSLYDEGLRAWVFVLVYVSFMVWGAALSVLTATYLTGTRPPCADHARLPIPDLLGR